MTDGEADRMDTLLRERGSIQASHEGANTFMQSGGAVAEALRAQNRTMAGTTRRMTDVRGLFTSIDTIYNAIQRKQTRDFIIISCFTATLICFLLFWWLRS